MQNLIDIVGYDADEFSSGLSDMACTAFRDTVAVMVAGWEAPTSAMVRNALETERLSGVGPCDAALAWGTAAHVLEFDDSHFGSLAHPSAVLIPSILAAALAAQTPVTMADAWKAYVVGLRMNTVIGSLTSRVQYYSRGFHTTSTVGVFGATAAAGRILSLTGDELVSALAIAASNASGLRVNFETDVKPLHAGVAASAGVRAALLARSGIRGSTEFLFGENGYAQAYTGSGAGTAGGDELSAVAVDEQGQAVLVPPSIKKFPSCGASHAPVEAAIMLRERLGLGTATTPIQEVVVRQSAGAMAVLTCEPPRNPQEAQFSLNYCVSAALRDGALTLPHFTPAAVQDAFKGELMARVRAEEEPAYSRAAEVEARFPASVTVVLPGQVETVEVAHAPGGVGNPLDEVSLRTKFDSCLPGGWMQERGESLWRGLGDSGQGLASVVQATGLMDLAP